MIMTQKTKDLLHAIIITIFEIICIVCFGGGLAYLIATSSGTLASISATVAWGVIFLLGATVFGWGTYVCWDEWFYHYKKKKEE